MLVQIQQTTSYLEVNRLLQNLLVNVQMILGKQFIGLYLYGSLASGGFNPETSDIDFLVVTSDELSDNKIDALGKMHASLAISGLKFAAKLEGAYIPQDIIRKFDPDDLEFPWINEGKFYLGRQGSDWIIQRHVLREQGVIVGGPDPTTLIDPVSADDIQQAILGILESWWAPMLSNPARLEDSEYQAYAILFMCRTLHTLETGVLGSKPEAAHWALDTLDPCWQESIEDALCWQEGSVMNKFDESLEFIRYTVEQTMIYQLQE
ncbi:MAG: aminoglycoside adenylyltransferase domain-containing protein [Chloroflexota bacterium]